MTGPVGPRVVVAPFGRSFIFLWRPVRFAHLPPLVPNGTTFPPQAGAQQGFVRQFLMPAKAVVRFPLLPKAALKLAPKGAIPRQRSDTL